MQVPQGKPVQSLRADLTTAAKWDEIHICVGSEARSGVQIWARLALFILCCASDPAHMMRPDMHSTPAMD